MSPATPWVEATVPAVAMTEGFTVPGGVDAVILFGIVMPIVGGTGFVDPTASWTERTAPAIVATERTVAASTFVERAL